jgi:hypothetical protein
MKRSLFVLFAIALALSLASCTFLDQLLSVNLFEETMELSAADVESSSVGELLVLSESESFFEALEADPDAAAAVLGKTSYVIDPANIANYSDLEIQEAGILGANVLIYTSPAGDLLANATGLADADPAGITDMEELLDLIMPDSVYTSGGGISKAPFVEMINAFVAANDYYIAIGTSLATTELVPEGSAGDLAVGAFIAAAINEITKPGIYLTMGDYLYAALTDPLVDPPLFEDPDLAQSEYAYLDAILNAANLGDLLDL